MNEEIMDHYVEKFKQLLLDFEEEISDTDYQEGYNDGYEDGEDEANDNNDKRE